MAAFPSLSVARDLLVARGASDDFQQQFLTAAKLTNSAAHNDG